MRALCMCLVFILSSCTSVDRMIQASFTPPPVKLSSFYELADDGTYQYPEGYTADFAIAFEGEHQACACTINQK